VVKLDSTGSMLWQRVLGGNSNELWMNIQQTSDGGYILAGYSSSRISGDVTIRNPGGNNIWVVKIDEVPTISLKPGWNFISTPKALAPGSDTASIFSGIDTDGHSILQYDSTQKNWITMNTFTLVKPLDGIWIYSKTKAKVTLGLDPNPVQTPPTKNLAVGWNAIGFSSLEPAEVRSTLVSVRPKWLVAIGYDAATQRYETSMINGEGAGKHNENQEMIPGKGYWLGMSEPGQLLAIGA
jgi:hypothetical protein